jgi:4-hydroxybenzoate polyprenyltransferase
MGKLLFALLKTARPRQWLKNVAVITTILFTGQLFNGKAFNATLWAFMAFCLLSSSSYFINDILDISRDRKHPFKKFRPIASRLLPLPIAWGTGLLLLVIGISISVALGNSFLILALFFMILQYSYSFFLKHKSIIDILAITTAYFLRVYAGEMATGYHISIWLALAALSLALFLTIGKRRAELTLIQGYKAVLPKDTRETLLGYSEKLLDAFTAMFATSTFITYAFYTFLEKPLTHGFFFHGYNEFASDLPGRKWMMATIPFVLFGIMRYMQLIYEGKGESPEKVLTSDLPLLSTVILWGVSVFLIVYGIGG